MQKQVTLRYIWLFFLLIACAPVKNEQNNEAVKTYLVIRVSDGDTVVLLDQGTKEQIKVRLQGVDCPEKSQDYGTKARQFTSNLCYNKDVGLIAHKKDQYGRTLGEIILPDGQILNKLLIQEGYGWHYTQYDHNPEYDALEKQARAQKKGLWADSNPTPPWEYRKDEKEHREEHKSKKSHKKQH